MGSYPSHQRDLFEPPQEAEALPACVQTRLQPLLLALLMEAASMSIVAETASGEIGDDQDHA